MSLPAPAVPCLLLSSPQPSHAHTTPLQIFFPFQNYSKITSKQSQNPKSPLFRAFPQTRSTPRKSHALAHHSRERTTRTRLRQPKPPQSSHTSFSPIRAILPPGAKSPFQNTLSFFFNSKLIHVPPCPRRALSAAFQPSTLSHTFSRPYPPLAIIFPLRNYSKITAKQSHLRQNPLFRAFLEMRLFNHKIPQSHAPAHHSREEQHAPTHKPKRPQSSHTSLSSIPDILFSPGRQNHLFKIPFLSFSIPNSSMSLPASAVPCLLPTSPQPSHAHAHPLQIFFPFEITQKLLQNKATSVKILFLGHSRNEIDSAKISRPRASFQRRATRPDSQTKTAPIQPHFTFANPDHSFSPGSKTTFSKYLFFLFQFQAHPCPSLPPPCSVCCLPPHTPSHTPSHAHPLQIFFPSEITPGLL